jgi:hypothetical protein
MQEPSSDPLIESSLENENKEFSEWKILMLPSPALGRVSLSAGYRNSDFRDNREKSVVDLETYRKLFQEIGAAGTTLIWKRTFFGLSLYVGVVPLVAAMATLVPELKKGVLLGGLLGYFFLAAVTYHFVCEYLFTVADTQLIALVDSYQLQFLEEYGVDLGHSKSTHQRIRWWNDDSGIYLRRPRRPVEEEGPLAVSHGSESEGPFQPIFLLLTVPGDNGIDEMIGDPTMKNKARSLLQSTYKETVKTLVLPQAFWGCCHLVVLVFVIAFSSWLVKKQYDFFGSVLVFLIGYNVLGCLGGAFVHAASRRRLASYKEVAQRVNEALEKDEQLAHLAVEFHDSELPGYPHMTSLRFQFVRRADTALSGALAVMV